MSKRKLWSFIGKKQKRVRPEDEPEMGDAYTFVAIERSTKLVLNIAMGKRDQATTDVFIEGLRLATSPSHFQITTDGFAPYRTAIPDTLGDHCDYDVDQGIQGIAGRRRPLQPCGSEIRGGSPVMGQPDPERICPIHPTGDPEFRNAVIAENFQFGHVISILPITIPPPL